MVVTVAPSRRTAWYATGYTGQLGAISAITDDVSAPSLSRPPATEAAPLSISE